MESTHQHHGLELSAERRQVAVRSTIALGLMALFYLLAAGVIAALGWGTWVALGAMLHGGGVWSFFVGGSLGAATAVVAGAMIPRGPKFVPPGPALTRATHAALFNEVELLAADTRQKMPDSIYLLNDVNAFVADYGGVLGLGGRRMLGIGLPLLCGLDRQQLRSVLGHEFGHFCGGDTLRGPWIYRGRRAMITAANNLTAVSRTLGGFGIIFRVLSIPFTAYAVRFVSFTQDLSRRQELAADPVGAKLAGAASSIAALRAVEICAAAFDVYFKSELVPLIRLGCVAPVAEGFRRFLATDVARRLVAQVQAEPRRKADTLDSHPSLAERVAALTAVSGPHAGRDDRPAAELLHELAGYELALVRGMLDEDSNRELRRVTWKEVGTVLAEQWHRIGAELAVSYLPRTFEELPIDPHEHRALAGRHTGKDVSGSSEEDIAQWARWALMHLVFAGLTAHGLRCDSLPGEPVRFSDGRTHYAVAEVVDSLLRGAITRDDWRRFCRSTGLSKVDVEALAAHSSRYQEERELAEA
jgi:Zn-dependent protease with chaperone function